MQIDQKRVTQLSTEKENHCPLCLQSLNDEYKSAMLQRIQTENAERQTTIKRLQGEIDKLQRTKLAANETFTNMQTLTSRLEDLKLTMSSEEKNLVDLLTEQNQKQNADRELQTQLDAVQFEIGSSTFSIWRQRAPSVKSIQQYYATESDLRTKENRKETFSGAWTW